MLVALLALVVSLAGVSYAAVTLPKNSVGAKQLQKNAVSSKKVKDGSLAAADFGAGQLPAGVQGPKGDQGDPGTSAAAVLTSVVYLNTGNSNLPMSGQATTGTFSAVESLSPNVATVARNFAVQLDTAPGAGNGRQFRLRVNGVATTLCSMSNSATSCAATGAISIPAAATLSIICVDSGGSAPTVARWGMTIGTS